MIFRIWIKIPLARPDFSGTVQDKYKSGLICLNSVYKYYYCRIIPLKMRYIYWNLY